MKKTVIVLIMIVSAISVFADEVSQTLIAQTPIDPERKSELMAFFNGPLGIQYTQNFPGHMPKQSGFTKTADGSVNWILVSTWSSKEAYAKYAESSERGPDSQFLKTIGSMIAGKPSFYWIENYTVNERE